MGRNHGKRTKFIDTLKDEEDEVRLLFLSPHDSIDQLSLDELKAKYHLLINLKFDLQTHLKVISRLIVEVDSLRELRISTENNGDFNEQSDRRYQRGK